MSRLPADPYEEWTKAPPTPTVLFLPPDVQERLKHRARAANLMQENGTEDVLGLLYRAWTAHEGCVCTAALDAVAADDSDPDMQALQRATVAAAMERSRAN